MLLIIWLQDHAKEFSYMSDYGLNLENIHFLLFYAIFKLIQFEEHYAMRNS